MKRIKLVEASNLKGCTFSHGITAPVTAIIGPNGEGKTSVLDAIELSLTGQLSWLRGSSNKPLRQPREIYDTVATGSALSAVVKFGDGTNCHYNLTKRGDTVKSDCAQLELPPVMLDPLEYLSLSEPERVKFLFAKAKLVDDDAGKLSLVIAANAKNIKFESNTPQTEQSLRELVEFIAKQKANGSPQDYLSALLADAKERAKTFQAVVQRLEKTGQGLTQVSGESPRNDAEQVLAQRRRELESAQAAQSAANSEVTRLQDLVTAAQLAQGRLANAGTVREQKSRLEAEIATLTVEASAPDVDIKKPQDALVSASREVSRLEAAHNLAGQNVIAIDQRIKTLEQLVASYTPPTLIEQTRQQGLVNELADLQKLVAEWQKPDSIDVGEYVVRSEYACAEVKKTDDQWNKQNEEIQNFASLSCCPTCKGSASGWKDIVLTGMKLNLDELAKTRLEANKMFFVRQEELAKATAKMESNAKVMIEHNDRLARIKTIETELAAFATAEHQAADAKRAADELVAARASREQAATALETALDALNKALEVENEADTAFNDARDCANALASKRTSLTLASGRLNDLNKQLAEFAVAESVAAELPHLQLTLTQALTDAKGQELKVSIARQLVADAEAEARKLVAWRGEQAAKARAAEEKQKAEADRHCAKQLVALLEELQSEMVKATIGPLVDRMNEVFAICGERLEIRDNVLGAVGADGFYAFRSFCGSKRALAMCAASVALSQDSPFKLAVIDEATRLDAESKVKLVRCMLSLVAAGKIDQCLIVDTDAAPYSAVADAAFGILKV